ncbi:MAG: HdeD family acid-resistance protein [Proteobacteria bacterium]|nr:HdeD family acid-resistance protein [Pseudomonadota bacterium]
MTNASRPSAIPERAVGQRPARSSWFVTLGMVYLMAGALAAGHLVIATIVTVYYIGALMTAAGAVHVIHAFQHRPWGGFLWWLLAGFLYAAGGIFAFLNPMLASSALTFALAILVLGSGVTRTLLGFHMRPGKGWRWIVASGVASIIVGLVFLSGWSANSLWLPGLILTADLFFQGCTLLLFGMGLKATA